MILPLEVIETMPVFYLLPLNSLIVRLFSKIPQKITFFWRCCCFFFHLRLISMFHVVFAVHNYTPSLRYSHVNPHLHCRYLPQR